MDERGCCRAPLRRQNAAGVGHAPGPALQHGPPTRLGGEASIDTIIRKTLDNRRYLGVGIGTDVKAGRRWVDRGIQWVQFGVEYMYLLERMRELYTAMHRLSPLGWWAVDLD